MNDLGCQLRRLLIRWPDPSASPQDDRVHTAQEIFLIRITVTICCPIATYRDSYVPVYHRWAGSVGIRDRGLCRASERAYRLRAGGLYGQANFSQTKPSWFSAPDLSAAPLTVCRPDLT